MIDYVAMFRLVSFGLHLSVSCGKGTTYGMPSHFKSLSKCRNIYVASSSFPNWMNSILTGRSLRSLIIPASPFTKLMIFWLTSSLLSTPAQIPSVRMIKVRSLTSFLYGYLLLFFSSSRYLAKISPSDFLMSVCSLSAGCALGSLIAFVKSDLSFLFSTFTGPAVNERSIPFSSWPAAFNTRVSRR